MDSLFTKIRNFIKGQKHKDFRASVTLEKHKKYLFQEPLAPRERKKWNIFKKGYDRLSPFSRYIQEKISLTEAIRKKQEFYLRYIGLFLILASLYIIFYSPYFLLSPSKILIEGLDEGVNISIAYRSMEDFYGENIFLIDEEKIANTLREYQKNLSSVEIDHLYPNSLKILLSGYPITFRIEIPNIENSLWGMTENGILIPPEEKTSKEGYSLAYIDPGMNDDLLLEYRELISPGETQILKKTIDFFRETWSDLAIKKSYYLAEEKELHVELENTTRIILTVQNYSQRIGEVPDYNGIRLQLLGLKAFIDKNYTKTLEGGYIYIDARVYGKVFACSDPALCRENITNIYPSL